MKMSVRESQHEPVKLGTFDTPCSGSGLALDKFILSVLLMVCICFSCN